MLVRIKIAYEIPDQSDGFRVLVDRIWSRGVSKEDAQIDQWEKAVAPSNDLRKWFGHDPNKFQEFKEKYKTELASGDQHESLEALKQLTKKHQKNLTLVFAAKDEQNNQAVVLIEILHHRLLEL